jgi:hypothetical protein
MKSWTLEAPRWTMMGPPISSSFSAILKKNKNPKGILSVFYSQCKFKNIYFVRKFAKFLVSKN